MEIVGSLSLIVFLYLTERPGYGNKGSIINETLLIQLSDCSRVGFGRQIVRDAKVGMIRPYSIVLHIRTHSSSEG